MANGQVSLTRCRFHCQPLYTSHSPEFDLLICFVLQADLQMPKFGISSSLKWQWNGHLLNSSDSPSPYPRTSSKVTSTGTATATSPKMTLEFAATVVALFIFIISIRKYFSSRSPAAPVPISVNYHLTRKCNYACGFCFHTAKTSYILPLPEAKKGLALLRRAGMKKLNFAGGEPMLYPDFVGELSKYCKEELGLESVSIVTNGSLVKNKFLASYGKFIDIIAVSCDSFNEATNVKIGRGTGSHLKKLVELRGMCAEHGVKFKLNTVVNKYNFEEDMREAIKDIAPFRWKCFQVLVVKGENDSANTLRDATHFVISDEQFRQFCEKHEESPGFVPEPNNLMKDSYLILDEYMRFLDKGNDPSKSILEIGVTEALRSVFWDEESFLSRGGIYDWSRTGAQGDDGGKELEW